MSPSTPKIKKPRGVRITDRDLTLFEALSSYRILSTAQVAALFTPSYEAAQRLLLRLHRAELIIRVFQPIARSGSAQESIWALARKGAAEVARAKECPLPSHMTAKEQRSNLFIDHTLARNDFRICFELLHRQGKLELLTWKQSPEEIGVQTELRGPHGGRLRVPLVPDGYFAVRYKDQTCHLLLESDMGTVALKRMALKYRGYWTWWKQGEHRRRFAADNLRVLTVTSSYTRLDNLRRLAMNAPNRVRKGSGLFWFSTLAHVDPRAPEELLERIWWSARASASSASLLLE